jgi:hypothetical protein
MVGNNPFNLIIGSAGLVACILVVLMALAREIPLQREFGIPDPPIFAAFEILIYGILANVCYTLGWIAELILRKF